MHDQHDHRTDAGLTRQAVSATLHCLTGCAIGEVLGLALAADTVSITVMEIVDNVTMVTIPGAMEAGLSDALFWATMALGLGIAFVLTVPVNRALIARGKGHAVAHAFTTAPPTTDGGYSTGSCRIDRELMQ